MPQSPPLPAFSVAVLSHKRPHLLARVLGAIAQQDYPLFEIVVVGDQPDIAAFRLPAYLAGQVKYIHCGEANICRSRNLALEVSAGELVAFCDDDAMPEPDWLRQLSRAFVFPDVGGVGGLVRGSDGLRIEWRGGTFDRTGHETTMPMRDDIRVFDADSQTYGNQFVGTMGANSAFRREAVLSVGGFDESFHYYLDETDLMLRLAEAGWDAAIVLAAEVHHVREENTARDGLRTPRNLFEIAASKAYFCRRHMREGDVAGSLEKFLADRMDELDPYIRLGLLRRRDRARLRKQVQDGLAVGLARSQRLPMTESFAATRFQPFAGLVEEPISVAFATGWNPVLTSQITQAARLLAARGHRVTRFSFKSGWRPRSVRFRDGVWVHEGGTWRLDHMENRERIIRRSSRARAELHRVGAHRRIEIVLSPDRRFLADATEIRLPGISRPLFAAPGRFPGRSVDAALEVITDVLRGPWQSGGAGGNPAGASHGSRDGVGRASTIPG